MIFILFLNSCQKTVQLLLDHFGQFLLLFLIQFWTVIMTYRIVYKSPQQLFLEHHHHKVRVSQHDLCPNWRPGIESDMARLDYQVHSLVTPLIARTQIWLGWCLVEVTHEVGLAQVQCQVLIRTPQVRVRLVVMVMELVMIQTLDLLQGVPHERGPRWLVPDTLVWLVIQIQVTSQDCLSFSNWGWLSQLTLSVSASDLVNTWTKSWAYHWSTTFIDPAFAYTPSLFQVNHLQHAAFTSSWCWLPKL